MNQKLIDLFKLLQITRDQPQYGYDIAGILKHELSDLAQHHYLVTFITWQLCKTIEENGGQINTLRAVEMAMIHDLGELFGGDINFFYAQKNPKARELAKKFEHENNLFLSQFFPNPKNQEDLIKEMSDKTTDESIVAKVADYTEVMFYKIRLGRLKPEDIKSNGDVLKTIAESAKDQTVKSTLLSFLEEWPNTLPGPSTLDIINHV